MTAAKTGRREVRRSAERQAGALLDPGETRAVVLTAVAIAIFLYFVQSILLPFVLAGAVAYVCTPLLNWLAERTRLPRALFAVVLFLILLGVAAFFFMVAAQHVVAEAKGITTDLQGMLENFVRQLLGNGPVRLFGRSMDAGQIVRALLEQLRDWFGRPNALLTVAGYSLATVMGIFLTAVLLFYFLVSGRGVARGLFSIVPPNRRPLVRRIWTRLDPMLKRYFLGVIVVVIYATAAAYVGLGVILGIQHAILLAFLTGILETVPMIGPIAAAIIAGLVSLRTATGVGSILAYAAYATLLRLSIDEIIGPLVLGRAAHVHPVLIMFCFLAGAVLLGIPGVILAVPVALIIKNTLATLYGEAEEE